MKLAAVFLLFVSCFFNEDRYKTDAVQEPTFELILQEQTGGPAKPQMMVVKGEKSLKDFYIQINKTRRPGLPVPEINFKEEKVIILCMGSRTTGGYSIEIEKLEEKADLINIYVREKGSPSKYSTSVLTEPFSIYKIKAADKKLVFKKADQR
ncbi:protease complex subunit PrcB family protein [Leptobacterium flavescens]|uniref:Protease complex subunit PrcB family protein n=1 Tax=Leptobacterium flavescens TaxID=472055 RepID=A0A6P0ULV7_9FLAO|nr:protease complex subunit PrcB family protein [Leptobacterium flavescens]NER13997.1 protease complex subunit PrcB family protein [Leptobacterium flavescens]